MAGLVTLLREIHRHQRHAHDLREQLNRLPYQIKAQKAKAVKHNEMLREAQEALKRLKVKISDKEKSLKAAHQQIAKFEGQRNESTSKKEYDAFNLEIAHVRQTCSQLEEEILTAMVDAEERAAALPALESTARQAREEAEQSEGKAKQRQETLDNQLAEVLAQIREVEKNMPADIRTQYERAVKGRGADALSALRDRTCAACSTEITAQNYNDLLAGNFVICKTCGRILYLPD